MTDRASYPWLASGLLLGSLLTLGILGGVPQQTADTLTYIGLAAGFLLAISSFLSFLGIEFRRLLAKRPLTPIQSQQVMRQAVEFAGLLIAGAALWVTSGLNWWEASLMVAAVVFAELALSSRQREMQA